MLDMINSSRTCPAACRGREIVFEVWSWYLHIVSKECLIPRKQYFRICTMWGLHDESLVIWCQGHIRKVRPFFFSDNFVNTKPIINSYCITSALMIGIRCIDLLNTCWEWIKFVGSTVPRYHDLQSLATVTIMGKHQHPLQCVSRGHCQVPWATLAKKVNKTKGPNRELNPGPPAASTPCVGDYSRSGYHTTRPLGLEESIFFDLYNHREINLTVLQY